MPLKRLAYPLWILFLALLAAAHAWHLRADFPNHSPWEDWSKYTDEGWYGNAAIRAHLFGNWYVPGDFNPAPAVPVWPFLEWVLFFVTGVSIQAARGLAVGFFFVNLLLSYKLFRERGPRWVALIAVTLLVTSPFIYCFSRLAILEPLLVALTLAAMNLAVRLPRFRHREGIAALIGLIFTLMMLTKTTALFLLPALIWMIVMPTLERGHGQKRKTLRLLVSAGGAAALSFSLWMLLVIDNGLFEDYKYLFFVNSYPKPKDLWGHIMSFYWSFHGGLWADQILIPLAGILILGVLLFRRKQWTRGLWRDPLFSGSALCTAGYIGFMTYQNHPQPRYYVVVAFFSFFVVVRVTAQLLYQPPQRDQGRVSLERKLGFVILAVVSVTAAINSFRTLNYAMHPQYTWVTAAESLTRYIDQHPNGNRILVSISGDEISLVTHVPSLCDDFGTEPLDLKLARYKPGWYATWNDLDPGTLEDIHTHFSLEQVASFPAFDDPERNVLYLFKLHPLPNGEVREPDGSKLEQALPDDDFDVDVD